MSINRANRLIPINTTTVDSAAGIDIRLLSVNEPGVDDTTQSVRFTHTQDGQERTFDPATGLVTVETDPLTFQGEGWALRLSEDMTPDFPPFDAADITGLQLWIQADAISGLANNDPVTTWEDSSSNNRDFTQATETNKPLYKTNILNGLPGVLFDGINDWMASTSFAVSVPHTIFVVVKLISYTAGAGTARITADNDGSAAQIFLQADDDLAMYSGTELGGNNQDFNAAQITAKFNGASSVLYRNGTLIASGNAGTSAIASGMNIGHDHNASDGLHWLDGYFFELLIYSGALSDSDRGIVESYLRSKWVTP